MAAKLLHLSVHLLSNKTSLIIIIKVRRLDGKQRGRMVLF